MPAHREPAHAPPPDPRTPGEDRGDQFVTPFALVLDELDGLSEDQRHTWDTKEVRDRLARITGARCALTFPFRVDLPANDYGMAGEGSQAIHLDVTADRDIEKVLDSAQRQLSPGARR